MKRLRFLRFRTFLLFVLFLLFLVGQGAPGLVQAQAMDLSDFACWATGDFPGGVSSDPDLSLEPNWGNSDDEFVVDFRDLGNDVLLLMDLKADYLGAPHVSTRNSEEGVYTLFDSMSEMVDYTFALNFSPRPNKDRSINDRRVQRLFTKFADPPGAYSFDLNALNGYPLEDRRFLLPWDGSDGLDKYLDRRRVAVPYKNVVQSYSGQWVDPANPGGGRVLDFVALARDQAANRLEALEGTVTAAGDGGVVHYGTIEAVAQQFTFQSNNSCSGPSCSGVTKVDSELVPVTFHTSVREQNDGQTYRNITEAGDRVVRMFDVDEEARIEANPNLPVDLDKLYPKRELEFDLSYLPPSTLPLRDPGSGAYYRRYQENTGFDQLHINLVLQDRYRRDLNFDPDSGSLYAERGLPAMGFEPWTYNSISDTGRDVSVNKWFRFFAEQDLGAVEHHGYRQPSLNRVYSNTELSPPSGYGSSDRIRWPANLEDLNWYLYQLPSTGYRDPLWLYWVSDYGRRRLVTSAYGKNPVPFPRDGYLSPGQTTVPDCFLPGEREEDGITPLNYAASGYRPPLNIDAIKCDNLDPLVWNWMEVWQGKQSGVNLPFDSDSPGSSGHLLGDDLIIKQGVESAADSGSPIGTRQLNRFDFFINESERMGDFPPGQKGYDAERRYGLPRDGVKRNEYVGDWAFRPVDPNMPHLLVVTFYEAKIDKDLVDFRIDDDVGSLVFSLPKRRLQQVICRMFVHPSGNAPWDGIVDAIKDGLANVRDFIGQQVDSIKGFFGEIIKSIAGAPVGAVRKSTGLVCVGAAELDRLSGLESTLVVSSVSLRDGEGRIRLNSASQSKLDGIEECHEMSTPMISTCKRSADVVFEGVCTRLPELRLRVREADFITPPAPPDPPTDLLKYREYGVRPIRDSWMNYGDRGVVTVVPVHDEVGFEPKFLPLANVAASSPDVLMARNVGLTRAFLDWEVRWDNVSSDIHEVIDGFMVFVYPDQKSSKVLVPEGGFGFALPKFVQVKTDRDRDYRYSRVDGFSVGGLNYYPDSSTRAKTGSDSLFSSRVSQTVDKLPLGVERVTKDYESFNNLIHNMPLAPGFEHGFEVAPYVGSPPGSDFEIGPRSERIILKGDKIACDNVPYTDVVDFEKIRDLYDCGDSATLASLGYADDGFRPGLLALTGTDMCTDIFSSTPASFTWDNPAVHQVWGLVWIIAGGVLFTLLVWQGLRMTYDVWLDPQPSIGFRELVPRFLLAAALAVSSLIICRMVLVVASDLTCFVAQTTNMTMWGVIGSTFGALGGAFSSWFQGEMSGGIDDDVSFLLDLNTVITALVMGFISLVVIFFILFLFLKVLFAMLLRVALLAILIALAPLAFAFYASDATSHWTKKWVTLFLGTTFQQVVVLVVIYLGISIMDEYFGAGENSGAVGMLVGAIVAFTTLSLATAVPDLVNPGGKGLFSSLGPMAMMAVAGAAMTATAVVGAIAGGVGAVAGGAGAAGAGGGAASGALGGGGGALGGGGAAAGGGGAAAGGGGAAAGGGASVGGTGAGGIRGDSLISSVNRRPMGPPGGPASGPTGGGPTGGGPTGGGPTGGGPTGGGPPSAPAGGPTSAPAPEGGVTLSTAPSAAPSGGGSTAVSRAGGGSSGELAEGSCGAPVRAAGSTPGCLTRCRVISSTATVPGLMTRPSRSGSSVRNRPRTAFTPGNPMTGCPKSWTGSINGCETSDANSCPSAEADVSLGSYDSPTFLGQKDKYMLGLSLPELMVSMAIGAFWFFLMFLIPVGFLIRILISLPLTGASMSLLFVRISGLSIPGYLLLSLVRLFRRPSYEEAQEFVLGGAPAWLDLERQKGEKNSRFFGLVRKGRRAAASVPEAQRAEMRAEMDRQVAETAAGAESWARDAIRSLVKGK